MPEQLPTLIILGAGGHARVVADAAAAQARWDRIVATDHDAQRWGTMLVPGVPVLPPQEAWALDGEAHVAIGAAAVRQRELASLGGRTLAVVVHPRASVSAAAQLGPGCFVAAQAVVAPNARLGRGTIVNHGAVVDHDCDVGEACHIAPQAALAGGVRTGDRVLLGAGAHVLPGLSVCDDVVVGAGAVVHRPVTEPGVYVGVPARRMS